MNFTSARFAIPFIAAFLAYAQTALAIVGFTLSPPVTSNTYSGVITLQISGLQAGEQVIIRKWLDLNGNGVIDPGEPMIDAFRLTDNNNNNAIIGGVTNVNIPFDTDPTPGSITATHNVPGTMVLENIVGQQIYQVVSPTNHFSPITATLTITNAGLAQSLSGIVYGNDGVTPFPNAVVVAQDQQANNPAASTVADSNGHFLLTLPASSYNLITAMPNYYYDMSKAPSIVLTNGMAATNNLMLSNGVTTIAGSILDSANSNGIGGLLMTLSSGPFFAIAFSDSNGNYSAAVTSGFWKIQPEKQRMCRRAYVLPQATYQVDATAGNVTNANIFLPRGNALFYGRITDSSNSPFANIELDGSTGNNVNNSYDAKGFTDGNGNYAVAVLGDNTNFWSCNANSGKNSALGNYVLNNYNSTTLSPNQAVLENFVALLATARITGHVQDNYGSNVVGVGLSANAMIGGNSYQSLDSTTDNSGNYSLAVASGQWYVAFFEGGYSDALDSHGYMDPYPSHTVNIPPTNAVLNITVYPIGTPLITGARSFGPNQFGFGIQGASNVTYTVQKSTNLASTNWTTLFSLILTNGFAPVADNNATNRAQFYRVLKNN